MSRQALYRRACWRLFCRYQRGLISRQVLHRLIIALWKELQDDRGDDRLCLN